MLNNEIFILLAFSAVSRACKNSLFIRNHGPKTLFFSRNILTSSQSLPWFFTPKQPQVHLAFGKTDHGSTRAVAKRMKMDSRPHLVGCFCRSLVVQRVCNMSKHLRQFFRGLEEVQENPSSPLVLTSTS